jgi:hypothetical protein
MNTRHLTPDSDAGRWRLVSRYGVGSVVGESHGWRGVTKNCSGDRDNSQSTHVLDIPPAMANSLQCAAPSQSHIGEPDSSLPSVGLPE